GKEPSRKRRTDAGYDVSSVESKTIKPGQTREFATGIHVKCPPGYFYLPMNRSCLSCKHDLEVVQTPIDATYTGELKIFLRNVGSSPYKVEINDRIAQLVFLPQLHVRF